MKRPAGFTLLELAVAIAITGLVALLVYGAANAALETQYRIEESERALRAEVAWQALLVDALRNVRSPVGEDEMTLRLEPGADFQGRPRDRLIFVSAGGTPPLTGDTDWTVTLEAGDAGGVRLFAAPLGIDAPAHAIFGARGATGLDVKVLGRGPDAEWSDSLTNIRELPRAVTLIFYTDSGPALPPILLNIPVEAGG
jgi:prepilin-type N-terminal cleavage/methylation domain-containing protein